MTDRTIASYVVRVMVKRGAWRIVLTDVRSGQTWTCASFVEVADRLERLAHAPTAV